MSPFGEHLSRHGRKAGGFAPSTPTKGRAFGIHYLSGLNSSGLSYWWRRLRCPLLLRPLKQRGSKGSALSGVQGQSRWTSFPSRSRRPTRGLMP